MPVSPNLPPLIRAVETADSKAAIVQAVRALAAAEAEAAIPTLITVLGYNNPGAAVAAVDGLVALGEAAVPALLAQLDGYNYGARAWSIRALALIGDPRALQILLDTASGDFALSVRRAAARGLGFIRWDTLAPEERAAAQTQVADVLTAATADPEWVVRYAAVVALEALAQLPEVPQRQQIHQRLQGVASGDDALGVQARAQMALDALA